MDCIDLFKKAAAALQTDPRYLELDAARRENDADEELQQMIGEFNLARHFPLPPIARANNPRAGNARPYKAMQQPDKTGV